MRGVRAAPCPSGFLPDFNFPRRSAGMATRHFFVDEAGDFTLFDKFGRPMSGREGVSKHFMVGVAEIRRPGRVAKRMETLRARMLADPYFSRAPSLQPERRRTALAFHAKDDLPEVRWRVYEQLRRCAIQFSVAVHRKCVLETRGAELFTATGQKLRLDEIYSDLVTRLFIGRFRDAHQHHVTFAMCKSSNRSEVLRRAIERARSLQQCAAPCIIASSRPPGVPGLQVVDYYLWATQRLFELHEGRFLVAMADHVEYVWDRGLRDRNFGEDRCRHGRSRRVRVGPG
jgi:Protein of unknown function (DUF3800)